MAISFKQLFLEISLPKEYVGFARRYCAEKVPLQSSVEEAITMDSVTIDANAAIRANESCYLAKLELIKHRIEERKNAKESIKLNTNHLSICSQYANFPLQTECMRRATYQLQHSTLLLLNQLKR